MSKLNKYIFVDPANSKVKDSDYTVAVVLGVGEDQNIYLIDMIRDRLDVKGREDMIFDLHKKYRPQGVYIEKYGMQVDIDWIKHAMNNRNYRFPVYELGGTMDKISRIRRLEAVFARGQMWLPTWLYKVTCDNKSIDVINEFITQEYITFPVSKHDDMLDAMSRIKDITIQYPGAGGFDYYSFAEGFK